MGDVITAVPSAGGQRLIAPAVVVALALAIGCSSSKPARVVEAAPPRSAPAAAAVGNRTTSSPTEIRSVELREGAPEVYVDLEASAPLVWTSFRNSQGDVVLELPNSVPGASVADLSPEDGLISGLKVERVSDGSQPLTRLVIATRQTVEHSVTAEGMALKLRLQPVEDNQQRAALTFDREPEPAPAAQESDSPQPAAQAAAETQTATDTPTSATVERVQVSAPAAAPAAGGTFDEPVVAAAPSGPHATRIESLSVLDSGAGAVVKIAGDGEFPYATFRLETPPRFVIDLSGVLNRSPRAAVAVDSAVVERVRVAQFKPMPNAVARVVFDLRRDAVPVIERTADSLVVSFPASAAEASAEPSAAPAAVAALEPTEPAEPTPPPPARRETHTQLAQLTPPPPPPSRPAERIEVEEAPPAPPVRPAAASAAVAAPRPTPANQPSDLQLVRSAATASEPAPASTNSAVDGLRRNNEERTYTGEPIDLKVTNADVTDVLRTFAQISGLNVIVQPGVTGTVTAEMENVPWDQALEQVLKINKLDYVLDGNVMRIAPVSVLRQEAQERQELAAAQALAIPLSTVMKRLNYAAAQEIAGLLRNGQSGLLSQRGSVIVDNRTNTLIIKELPNFLDTVVSVVEMLDTPEPQVMIEARIIETTKHFSRDLGIRWGFNALADAAHGNTTGLVFPNNVDATGTVAVGGSTGDVLSLRLGNVLNSFTLDVALQALESEGLIHILSAPKVATLNNQKASIQSGLQIPVQTIANNTVTVQFVNATLRLDVTPQVTADGTVMMDIDISKREPLQAFLVPGATNAPISTKDARTRLVVRDGGTAVIGGIYKISSNDNQDRIPGLANIPILGNLFKNRARSEDNDELLIFITPRVIKL